MAKGPEIRMSQGTVLVIVGLLVLGFVGFNAGWFKGMGTTAPAAPTGAAVTPPATTGAQNPPALTVVPAIEKTKLYVSTYDQADLDKDNQKNRVTGTMALIKSGNVLETVTTSSSTGVASTAEFNGGDIVTGLGDASGYYANAVEDVKIQETLQPIGVFIKAAHAPTVEVWDDKLNNLTSMAITLDMNDVSKTHSLDIERPGDKKFYQLCAIAADFDDHKVVPEIKDASGSFVEGSSNLKGPYDNLYNAGYDRVWTFDQPIKNFDGVQIPFIIGTSKDVDPSATSVKFVAVDCEKNLQNGKIVYTSEDSADADVGLANIDRTIAIN